MTVRVGLYSADTVGVLIDPEQGRWPGHERSDRVALAAGAGAWAAHRCDGVDWDETRAALRALAAGIAAHASTDIPGGLVPLGKLAPGPLSVVPHDRPPRRELLFRLLRAPVGPVMRLEGKHEGRPAVVAGLGLLLALGVDADENGRYAIALVIEGLLGFYADGDRMTPPRKPAEYALIHMTARLEEAGRPVPHHPG